MAWSGGDTELSHLLMLLIFLGLNFHDYVFYIIHAPRHERTFLLVPSDWDIKNRLLAIGGFATGLLNEEGDGQDLIDEL